MDYITLFNGLRRATVRYAKFTDELTAMHPDRPYPYWGDIQNDEYLNPGVPSDDAYVGAHRRRFEQRQQMIGYIIEINNKRRKPQTARDDAMYEIAASYRLRPPFHNQALITSICEYYFNMCS